jgi:hypothetical protein
MSAHQHRQKERWLAAALKMVSLHTGLVMDAADLLVEWESQAATVSAVPTRA